MATVHEISYNAVILNVESFIKLCQTIVKTSGCSKVISEIFLTGRHCNARAISLGKADILRINRKSSLSNITSRPITAESR
jgi:hypothetical protein